MEPQNPSTTRRQRPDLIERLERMEKTIQDQNDRLKRQDRKLAAHHRERMSLHARELEMFGELASTKGEIRPIYGADIKTDFQALEFLEQEEMWTRMLRAVKGFNASYGFSMDDYRNLRIPHAPSEIVFSINARSDIEYLPAYSYKKIVLANMCDEVIRRWKGYVIATDGGEYPQLAIDKKVRELKSVL